MLLSDWLEAQTDLELLDQLYTCYSGDTRIPDLSNRVFLMAILIAVQSDRAQNPLSPVPMFHGSSNTRIENKIRHEARDDKTRNVGIRPDHDAGRKEVHDSKRSIASRPALN